MSHPPLLFSDWGSNPCVAILDECSFPISIPTPAQSQLVLGQDGKILSLKDDLVKFHCRVVKCSDYLLLVVGCYLNYSGTCPSQEPSAPHSVLFHVKMYPVVMTII
ncbi:serine/arginine-rich splicing factor 7 [Platysternon megacephalum]|uniref:Serine/arginine-rich splicing factor 7 n=1 Tax=Platysternon megacephalum TaxID=55544 RepID=A0A4D9DZQ0_9SAUR|nr:serine/arginine-rich splicing factor 7 [Platysternon megacephalum]